MSLVMIPYVMMLSLVLHTHTHSLSQDVARYKRLDHRSQLRMSQALKHIGSLEMPAKSQIYGKSALQGTIGALLAAGKLK